MDILKKAVAAGAMTVVAAMPTAAAAHQPRIADTADTIKVSNPEISQAFYGELSGVPARFTFDASEPIAFYGGVLAPDLPGADKDYSISVMLDGRPWKLVTWVESDWEPFHEEYASDDYFKGPELRAEGPAGRYDIAVFSPDNIGKYVFVVGEKESFPLAEMVNALFVLPELKTDYFGKPWISAFTNKVGMYLGISALAVVALVVAAAIAVRRLLLKRRSVATVTAPPRPSSDGDDPDRER